MYPLHLFVKMYFVYLIYHLSLIAKPYFFSGKTNIFSIPLSLSLHLDTFFSNKQNKFSYNRQSDFQTITFMPLFCFYPEFIEVVLIPVDDLLQRLDGKLNSALFILIEPDIHILYLTKQTKISQ